jgi:multidrug efflux system membrane fusion protein
MPEDPASEGPGGPARVSGVAPRSLGRRLRRLGLLLLLAMVLGIAGEGVWVWADRPKPMASTGPAPLAPLPVITTGVRLRDAPIYLSGLGSVQASQSVTIKPRVDGQLQKVGFVEGQAVKEGDLIAQIDPRALQAQLEQAEAQKARDEAQLSNAQSDLARFTTLLKSDFASHQSVDTQKTLVAQLQAAVRTDQALIDFARVQLNYTTIRSPISGIAGIRLVDVGNIVHVTDQSGIVMITQIEPISATFTVPQDAFDDLRRAMAKGELKVYAFGRNDKTARAEGKLLLLDNQIDQSTGSLRLKAVFPNIDHNLWPGQFINVKLLLDTRMNIAAVPASVVQRGPSGTYAYLVKPDQSVEMRPVTVLQIADGEALISDGLAENDQVVVDGQYKLKPGVTIAAQPLKVVDGGPSATTGSKP